MCGVKKDFLIIFFIILGVAVLINGTEFQTDEEYYLTHVDDITAESETIFFEIDCTKALDDEHLSEQQIELLDDGIILENREFVLREGDTVFDLLKRICRSEKIQMEYQGADKNIYNSVYVQGINYLYEFDCGEFSGWIFLVNGEQVSTSCGKYYPADGDTISWVYTLDLGRDY